MDTTVISETDVEAWCAGYSGWTFGNISNAFHSCASNWVVTVRVARLEFWAFVSFSYASVIEASSVANWAE